jgi:hypothetical protein
MAIEATNPLVPIQGGATLSSMRVWVPGPVLCSAAHERVAAFHSSHDALAAPQAVYTPVSTIILYGLLFTHIKMTTCSQILSDVEICESQKPCSSSQGLMAGGSMSGSSRSQYIEFIDLTADSD